MKLIALACVLLFVGVQGQFPINSTWNMAIWDIPSQGVLLACVQQLKAQSHCVSVRQVSDNDLKLVLSNLDSPNFDVLFDKCQMRALNIEWKASGNSDGFWATIADLPKVWGNLLELSVTGSMSVQPWFSSNVVRASTNSDFAKIGSNQAFTFTLNNFGSPSIFALQKLWVY